MNLKMQMRPRRAAGVADVGNDLPGFDLLACGDADARAVRVQCRQSTAVVELDVVAITAAPTVEGVGDSDGAVGSRQDRGAFGHSDVGAAVVAGFASDRVGAVALRRSCPPPAAAIAARRHPAWCRSRALGSRHPVPPYLTESFRYMRPYRRNRLP